MSDPSPADAATAARTGEAAGRTGLTPGVRGIGGASLLDDVGHEIPTALLPSLLTATLGAPASALGVIEGVSDGLAGAARPGLLAVAAILYAIRSIAQPAPSERRPLRLRVRPVLRGRLRRLLAGVSVFELGSIAALQAIAHYVLYNVVWCALLWSAASDRR